ncbi:hypothetical protein LTR62_007467 [Meristemomyces frigidus]|uniref:Arginine biosynthesis bifunctional protein ArgJ, mitochondrial n=1 Tax=Meristemomyces frigidus TaxID=1508187 RepID=A0AAN7YIZ6_9PEZI|nr:hypothetical protein LTR62_007467 [Meristemomyces frigidus]
MERLIFHRSFKVKALVQEAAQIRKYSAPGERAIPAAKQKYVPTSGRYPKGFLAGSSHAGVKASNTQYDDIALVVSETPCVAAGVFTRNLFKAAPVQASYSYLRRRKQQGFRGVVVNSGCANAVTGKLGIEHASAMSKAADRCINAPASVSESSIPQTLVMSTGVIGQKLPIDKITEAIPRAHQALGASHENWLNVAKAICTTDTFPKLVTKTFSLPSHPEVEYSIAGMTKGAGMIHPNMGTLLGIVCTDAKIDPASITSILRHATGLSFNSISVDGDTSTNDTVALLANGAAAPEDATALCLPAATLPGPGSQSRGNVTNSKFFGATIDPDTKAFQAVLAEIMTDLAKLVVRDGEGATKFVTIRVRSDGTRQMAKQIGMSIAQSALVKTALYGKDANWGRILCAIGYAPAAINQHQTERDGGRPRQPVVPERTSVSFIPADGSEELRLLVRGEPEAVDEVRAKEILDMEDLEILVRLDDGPPTVELETDKARRSTDSVVWTCDFSHDYVTINGDYRT